MTRNYSRVAVAIVAAQFAVLPLAANADEEIRDLVGFDAIEVSGNIDLHITQNEDFLVEVIASSDELATIITEVRDGTLRIHRDGNFFDFLNWAGDYSVNVSLPELREIRASGGSDVRVEGTISGDSLQVRSSGGSDVALDVDVDELEVRTSGGSDLIVMGSARTLHTQSSGGSDLDARRLTAEEVHVQSSGGSDAEVTANGALYVRASGGSDVVYYGNPDSVDVDSSGGADITAR